MYAIRSYYEGRVFVTCQTHRVADPTIIGYYVEIVEQAVHSLLTEESTPAQFQEILEQQLSWLEQELDQVRSDPEMQVVTQSTDKDSDDVITSYSIHYTKLYEAVSSRRWRCI